MFHSRNPTSDAVINRGILQYPDEKSIYPISALSRPEKDISSNDCQNYPAFPFKKLHFRGTVNATYSIWIALQVENISDTIVRELLAVRCYSVAIKLPNNLCRYYTCFSTSIIEINVETKTPYYFSLI